MRLHSRIASGDSGVELDAAAGVAGTGNHGSSRLQPVELDTAPGGGRTKPSRLQMEFDAAVTGNCSSTGIQEQKIQNTTQNKQGVPTKHGGETDQCQSTASSAFRARPKASHTQVHNCRFCANKCYTQCIHNNQPSETGNMLLVPGSQPVMVPQEDFSLLMDFEDIKFNAALVTTISEEDKCENSVSFYLGDDDETGEGRAQGKPLLANKIPKIVLPGPDILSIP